MAKTASPYHLSLLGPPTPVLVPPQPAAEMTLEALYRRRDVLDRAILSLEAYQRIEDSGLPKRRTATRA